tara:strand:+ start:7378 stop:7938 length:561 start_codon:yes stop_codon:yes gene_type:complete
MNDTRDKWNRIYADRTEPGAPATALVRYAHLLPATGDALDVASGLGANARFLADRGLAAQAWDVSDVAITRIRHPGVTASTRDVEANPPAPDSFDVIVVSRFLDRPLCSHLAAALRPGGLLIYQTFVIDKPEGVGPSNPDFLLREGELLELFSGLTVLAFHDEGQVGDMAAGTRYESILVGRRPPN